MSDAQNIILIPALLLIERVTDGQLYAKDRRKVMIFYIICNAKMTGKDDLRSN